MKNTLAINNCFVCGPDNPIGLHLNIEDGDGWAKTSWIIGENYVGYANIIHGGIMATILDDLMAHATYSMKVDIMTVHLDIDYKAPAYVGDEIDCEAHIEFYGGRKSIKMAGSVKRGDTLIAEARGIVVIIGQNEKKA